MSKLTRKSTQQWEGRRYFGATALPSFAVLSFLVMREHRALNDSYLSKLSNVMLIFLVVYVVLFVGLFVLSIGQGEL